MATQEELGAVKLQVGQVQGRLSAYQAATSGTSDESATSNPSNAWISEQAAIDRNFLNRDRRTFCDRVRDAFFDIGTSTKANWKMTLIVMLVRMIGLGFGLIP